MSSIILVANTLVSTPTVGQMEYDGKVQTFTTQAGNRGIIPNEMFFRLDADLVGADSTAVQNIFGVGITLQSNTIYEFCLSGALVKTVGAVAASITVSFGGTHTRNNISWNIQNLYSGVAYPTSAQSGGLISGTNLNSIAITSSASSALISVPFFIQGTVSVNAGGTFIPQYLLSAAPGGAYSTKLGSHIKIKPIGVSGANINIGGWA